MTLWAFGGNEPKVDPDAWVHPDAHLIGDVVVRRNASVWPGAVLRGDFGRIEIGEGSSVQDNCVLHPGPDIPTIVGRDCVIGHIVHLEGVLIEDAVLIGSGSILLDGVIVRTGAIVAAGAMLLKNTEVKPGLRAQGLPAKLVAHDLSADGVRSMAAEYREMTQRYRTELRPIEGAR